MIGNEASYVLARQNDIIKVESNILFPLLILPLLLYLGILTSYSPSAVPVWSPTAAIGMQFDWQLINRVTVMRSRRYVTK